MIDTSTLFVYLQIKRWCVDNSLPVNDTELHHAPCVEKLAEVDDIIAFWPMPVSSMVLWIWTKRSWEKQRSISIRFLLSTNPSTTFGLMYRPWVAKCWKSFQSLLNGSPVNLKRRVLTWNSVFVLQKASVILLWNCIERSLKHLTHDRNLSDEKYRIRQYSQRVLYRSNACSVLMFSKNVSLLEKQKEKKRGKSMNNNSNCSSSVEATVTTTLTKTENHPCAGHQSSAEKHSVCVIVVHWVFFLSFDRTKEKKSFSCANFCWNGNLLFCSSEIKNFLIVLWSRTTVNDVACWKLFQVNVWLFDNAEILFLLSMSIFVCKRKLSNESSKKEIEKVFFSNYLL